MHVRSSFPTLLAVLLISATAQADPAEAGALLERWLETQNKGDFEGYQKLYAVVFTGVRRSGAKVVRLDRAGWFQDRARMFKKPMTVAAEEREIVPIGDGFRVTFTQVWSSGSYKDAGKKRLDLAREGGELRVAREELLESRRNVGFEGPGILIWTVGKDGLDELEEVARALSPAVTFGEGYPVLLDGDVVAIGVCAQPALGPMFDLWKALGRRVEARPSRGRAEVCPTFTRDADSAGEGWSWPGVSAVATVAGGDTLTVVALHRSDADMGDFARAYEENLFVSLLRAKDGTLREAHAWSGAGDYAELESLTADGKGVLAVESYIDAPCNGADKHRWKRIRRQVRYAVADNVVAEQEAGTRTVEKGRCSDAEARIYDKQ